MTASATVIPIVVAVSAGFGLAGSLFVIVSFCLFRTFTHHRHRLVLWMSVADFFDSCAWMLSPFVADDSSLCTIQAGMIQMFGFAGLLWLLFLAVHLLRVAFSNLRLGASLNVFWWETSYHVVAWGFPAFMTVYLFQRQEFGPAGPHHCWIEGNRNPARIYFGYGILFFVYAFNAVASLAVLHRMKTELRALPQSATRGNIEARHKVQQRLLGFIIVFGFCWIWGLANRIISFINPAYQQEWLFYFQAVLEPLTPMLNAIVFGYSERLRLMYVERFGACCRKNGRRDKRPAVGIRKVQSAIRRVEENQGIQKNEDLENPLMEPSSYSSQS